jgi:hypothetical protein
VDETADVGCGMQDIARSLDVDGECVGPVWSGGDEGREVHDGIVVPSGSLHRRRISDVTKDVGSIRATRCALKTRDVVTTSHELPDDRAAQQTRSP